MPPDPHPTLSPRWARSVRLSPRARCDREWQRLGPDAAQVALIRLAQQGDGDAEGFVIEKHHQRVMAECRRVLGACRSDLDDYVQEGKIALRTPIHRYDPSRGVPLWGYARWFVRGRVIDLLGASLGLTSHQTRLYRRLRSTVDALQADPARSGYAVEAAEVVEAFRSRYGFGVGVETAAAVLEVGVRGRGWEVDEARLSSDP